MAAHHTLLPRARPGGQRPGSASSAGDIVDDAYAWRDRRHMETNTLTKRTTLRLRTRVVVAVCVGDG